MAALRWTVLFATATRLLTSTAAQRVHSNYTAYVPQPNPFSTRDDCPPCFNCNLEDFQCRQFAECSQANGRCICPPGFGGDDCSLPLCGSLADGNNRSPREGHTCECSDGWSGVNCNVCTKNDACNALMPEGKEGVCYKNGALVKENYQMCDITNKKIVDQLKEKKPQASFSCNAETRECNFQCTSTARSPIIAGLT